MNDRPRPCSGGCPRRLHAMVADFAREEADAHPAAIDRLRLQVKKAHTAFVHGDLAQRAVELGPLFWMPPQRADAVFLHAYSALFCIPAFTFEALARQPDRFSRERLPKTVHITSSFILDAFGYDRRTETARKELYWPSLAIRMAHAERAPDKERISDAAMAYFAYQLVRAAEHLSPSRDEADFAIRCDEHYDYIGEFLRRADYPFCRDRRRMEAFALQVDHWLAGADCAQLLGNVLAVAPAMGVEISAHDLGDFLPTHSARVAAAIGQPPAQPTEERSLSIEIEYCVRCGYRRPAMELADAMLAEAGQSMSRVVLVPSDGGRFEIRVDDELVFSGLRRGRPPSLEEVRALLA